ncbi:hypothetical protein L083_6796 [Actinoplanes sp. N902-109]|nr:hypothetical protein L083_6796 [Actinoplanes sp. N902-109]
MLCHVVRYSFVEDPAVSTARLQRGRSSIEVPGKRAREPLPRTGAVLLWPRGSVGIARGSDPVGSLPR